MLVDRCLLSKRRSEWIGLTVRTERVAENYRFLAWIFSLVLALALIRILHISAIRMTAFDYLSVGFPALLAVVFFKFSSQKRLIREVVVRIGPRREVLDEEGMLSGIDQSIFLPHKVNVEQFDEYKVDEFTHVVFGLIDFRLPGKRETIVEAYALYLAHKDGSAIGIVESVFDKISCYQLAKKISAVTRLPLIELGKGQPFA